MIQYQHTRELAKFAVRKPSLNSISSPKVGIIWWLYLKKVVWPQTLERLSQQAQLGNTFTWIRNVTQFKRAHGYDMSNFSHCHAVKKVVLILKISFVSIGCLNIYINVHITKLENKVVSIIEHWNAFGSMSGTFHLNKLYKSMYPTVLNTIWPDHWIKTFGTLKKRFSTAIWWDLPFLCRHSLADGTQKWRTYKCFHLLQCPKYSCRLHYINGLFNLNVAQGGGKVS